MSFHPNMCHVLAQPISVYGLPFLRILITGKRTRAIFCLHPFQVTHELHLLTRVPYVRILYFGVLNELRCLCVYEMFVSVLPTVFICSYFHCSHPRQSGNTHEKY